MSVVAPASGEERVGIEAPNTSVSPAQECGLVKPPEPLDSPVNAGLVVVP
ncbi:MULTISPECIES: hypothetical protein [unclassified Mesorhizobium]|nr:hypothetical protein [Mesorhizobium sp. M7A.F.Ca.US.010.02.1.1]